MYSLAILVICTFAALLAYNRYLHWCNDEYDSVFTVLYAAAPNASISIGSEDEDGLGHYDVRDARLDLDCSGRRMIELAGPQGPQLRDGTHLVLTRVGPYYFTVIAPDYQRAYHIDIGSNGDFAKLLPIRFENIEDLVAHYDQLVASIGKLPPSSQFTTRAGKICELQVRYLP